MYLLDCYQISNLLVIKSQTTSRHTKASRASKQITATTSTTTPPNRRDAPSKPAEKLKPERDELRKKKKTNRAGQKIRSQNHPQPTTDNRTPEEILGLKAGWTQEDLRKIYKSESQRTHPDKWIGKPQAIRHAMEEEFKNIRQAFDQLKT